MTSMRHRAALFLLCAMITACSRTTLQPTSTPDRYHATIRWTAGGVPHIGANDWGSLGYGLAYAVATNAVCTLAREFVNVRGEQSKFFGPEDGRREADIFHKSVITEQRLASAAKHLPPQADALLEGYVRGYNRYIADHSGASLPASCRDQPWVRPIDRTDAARLNIGFAIGYGIGRAQGAIVQAAPPSALAMVAKPLSAPASVIEDTALFGSNAIALGKDATVNGRGMVLGNPHYPWSGANRFHMAHLTIPGEIDVMGVGLISTQFIGIGFNSDIAWTHTVSAALRSTLYELVLDPGDPLTYRYGTQTRRLTARTVRIDVLRPNGSLGSENHTVYDSHFGPVLEDTELPWTRERAFAIRDSNIDNDRTIEQYLKLARATSVEEVLEALRSSQGIAWANTIAADRSGKALYADLSVVPNLDNATIESCGATSVKQWRGRPVLRSTPECEWRSDARARQAGILPPQQLPYVIREDYVMNANDSHWLSNPAQPLEGFSPVVGDERTARSLRTRAGFVMIEEVLRANGRDKFDAARLQGLLFNHRNYGAELVLDDVLSVCKREPGSVAVAGATVDVTRACEILAAWDRRQDIDSRGAQVWAEFWPLFEKTPNLWRVPFDASEPVRTPRVINHSDPTVRAAVMESLARAVRKLEEAGVALDARWGDLQYVEHCGERIGIPGGAGGTGMFSVMSARLAAGKGYVPILGGNSWMQVVTWDAAGKVDARGLLAYSQSPEPDSPHCADQTRMYSRGEWLKLPFTHDEILRDAGLRQLELSGG